MGDTPAFFKLKRALLLLENHRVINTGETWETGSTASLILQESLFQDDCAATESRCKPVAIHLKQQRGALTHQPRLDCFQRLTLLLFTEDVSVSLWIHPLAWYYFPDAIYEWPTVI